MSIKLEGCFTAIVTPFIGTGVDVPVNRGAYIHLLNYQKEDKVNGVVSTGTTGESPTLSHNEQNGITEITRNHFEGIHIAGTGSNSTQEAIGMTIHAEDVGADASLQVCPYYNKPSQSGLYKHFGAIAESVDIPIILYDIPSRAGTEISATVMAKLYEEYSNVVGLKEATGDPDKWLEIREECGDDFIILSGDDGATYDLMKKYDAKGVISVASNLIPKRMTEFVALGLDERFDEMYKEHEKLAKFFKAEFAEGNPTTIKYMMNLCGLPAGGTRYPVDELTEEKNKETVKNTLREMGLLKEEN